MHNNKWSWFMDRHQCLQQDDMHNGDHGSYDTLIQDQMVMPYESAFSQVLIFQQWSLLQCSSNSGSPGYSAKTSVETVRTYDSENKAHYESEKESDSFVIGMGLGDEILLQPLMHVRQLKKCGKPSRVATMQVYVQFFNNFKPEWQDLSHL
ncbi:hypothetical protein Tco_0184380 [Tanacetum coccineum]